MLSRRIAIGVGLAVTTAVFTAGIEPSTSLGESSTPFGARPAAAYEIGELSPDDFRLYRKAFKLARKGRWSQARRTASQARQPLLHKVLQWLEFAKAGGGKFETIADFVDRNPDWPRLKALRRRAEGALDDTVATAEVLAWFRRHAPVTAKGAVLYAEALIASGATAEGQRRLRRAWDQRPFRASLKAFR